MRLVYLLLLTLLFPTAVFAQPYRTVSYDASGRKVITYICDPKSVPDKNNLFLLFSLLFLPDRFLFQA